MMEHDVEYILNKWQLLTAFSKKEALKTELWQQILQHYSEPHRHYHNLAHVAAMFKLGDQYIASLRNPAVVGFAIIYHDIVYNTAQDNNEEQSAAIARDHLSKLTVKASVIDLVEKFILATKTHSITEGFEQGNDLAYFLDFDLSVLGAHWDAYRDYSVNIRKEFSQYPDITYKTGRRHALIRLHKKEDLYFTSPFKDEFSSNARQNLHRELHTLL